MKSNRSKLVITRRSTVLILPPQLGFPALILGSAIECSRNYATAAAHNNLQKLNQQSFDHFVGGGTLSPVSSSCFKYALRS
jgi:hypothetical protein